MFSKGNLDEAIESIGIRDGSGID